jgi:glycosyltransferase involved in cell wall biosynthesis
MNIALFPSAFHPSLGGVEELSRQLALELQRLGHSVIVITNRWPRDLPEFETFQGLPLYRLAMRVPDGSARAKLNYHLTHRAIRRHLYRILRKHQVNVLHVQCVSANAHYALDAADRLKLPLFVTLQGELTMDAGQIFQHSVFAKDMLRKTLKLATAISGCSRKTLEDGEAFYGSPFGPRGHVVFNAARIHDFKNAAPFQHPRPYLFALGRMVPQKGFDTLLHAFSLFLKQTNSPHDLIIAGDGTHFDEYKALARELSLDQRVHFPGKADRAQTAAYFAGCDLFVLPSRADEGLPVVCAEALAAGKAVVATRSGGAPEVILHNQNGLIVDKGDTEALATAITQLITNPALRQSFEKRSLARAEIFDWSAITAQYVDLYEHAGTSAAESKIPSHAAT